MNDQRINEDCGIILTETPKAAFSRREAAKIAADVYNCNRGNSAEATHRRSLALETMNYITFNRCDRFEIEDILVRLGC